MSYLRNAFSENGSKTTDMLTLYRTQNCPRCGHIQEVLEDLAVKHDVVVTDAADETREAPEGTQEPVIVDDERMVQGSGDVLAYLEKLASFRDLWYKYQSDACYCGEESDEPPDL
mgnify:CR=1 FL=1